MKMNAQKYTRHNAAILACGDFGPFAENWNWFNIKEEFLTELVFDNEAEAIENAPKNRILLRLSESNTLEPITIN